MFKIIVFNQREKKKVGANLVITITSYKRARVWFGNFYLLQPIRDGFLSSLERIKLPMIFVTSRDENWHRTSFLPRRRGLTTWIQAFKLSSGVLREKCEGALWWNSRPLACNDSDVPVTYLTCENSRLYSLFSPRGVFRNATRESEEGRLFSQAIIYQEHIPFYFRPRSRESCFSLLYKRVYLNGVWPKMEVLPNALSS